MFNPVSCKNSAANSLLVVSAPVRSRSGPLESLTDPVSLPVRTISHVLTSADSHVVSRIWGDVSQLVLLCCLSLEVPRLPNHSSLNRSIYHLAVQKHSSQFFHNAFQAPCYCHTTFLSHKHLVELCSSTQMSQQAGKHTGSASARQPVLPRDVTQPTKSTQLKGPTEMERSSQVVHTAELGRSTLPKRPNQTKIPPEKGRSGQLQRTIEPSMSTSPKKPREEKIPTQAGRLNDNAESNQTNLLPMEVGGATENIEMLKKREISTITSTFGSDLFQSWTTSTGMASSNLLIRKLPGIL